MWKYDCAESASKVEETMYLHNMKLVDVISVPSNYYKITRLFLQNNFLQDLSGLENLLLLKFLDISFNHLQIINGLQHCHYLEELIVEKQISSNKYTLRIDPRSIETLRKCLKNLNCSGNNLDDIGEIGKLKKLKYLDLSANKLCNLNKLSNDLTKLPYLISLNLRDNKVVNQENYMRNIVGVLPFIEELDNKTISSGFRRHCMLRLRRSTIPESKVKSFPQYISKLCSTLPPGIRVDLQQKVLENNRNISVDDLN